MPSAGVTLACALSYCEPSPRVTMPPVQSNRIFFLKLRAAALLRQSTSALHAKHLNEQRDAETSYLMKC